MISGPSCFILSYRTLVGNDIDGTDHGYKVHIVYNVLGHPERQRHELAQRLHRCVAVRVGSQREHRTSCSGCVRRRIFPWTRGGSTLSLLENIELLLYGGPTTGTGTPDDPIVQNDPSLPSFIDLIRMLDAVEVPT
jgi:hypothetical protein